MQRFAHDFLARDNDPFRSDGFAGFAPVQRDRGAQDEFQRFQFFFRAHGQHNVVFVQKSRRHGDFNRSLVQHAGDHQLAFGKQGNFADFQAFEIRVGDFDAHGFNAGFCSGVTRQVILRFLLGINPENAADQDHAQNDSHDAERITDRVAQAGKFKRVAVDIGHGLQRLLGRGQAGRVGGGA